MLQIIRKNSHKAVCLFFTLVFTFAFFNILPANATSTVPEADPTITADFAILIDADSGTILYQKNADQMAYPASTTKIMTALIVCELATERNELDKEITVGSEVDQFTAANSRIEEIEGENIRIRDLLYGMMLLSGNDAAATLGIYYGGEEGFADLMNAKARELGLTNTHFANPHGIHVDDHYTTAADLAKIAQVAMQNELFREIVKTPSYTLPATNKHSEARTIYTTNKFISPQEEDLSYNWKPVTGIKTGHTNKAQACLVTSASQDGKNLISVILHDASSDKMARWTETRALLEYGFRNLHKLSLNEIAFTTITAQVLEVSKKDEFNGSLVLKIKADDVYITGLASELEEIKADPSNIEVIPSIRTDIKAPITEGEVCGTVTIKYNNNTIAVADLVATRNVASIQDDPQNPVDSLIQTVVKPEGNSSAGVVVLLLILLLIVLLVIMLVVRHKKLKKLNKSNNRGRYRNTKSSHYKRR